MFTEHGLLKITLLLILKIIQKEGLDSQSYYNILYKTCNNHTLIWYVIGICRNEQSHFRCIYS